MTIYSDLMKKQLEKNRNAVDSLFKAQYLVGVLSNMAEEIERIGLRASFSEGLLDITGKRGADAPKVEMKDLKIILDDFIFSDDRIEIDHENHTESWIFMKVIDKNTGGRFRIDIGMDKLNCKRIEVSRKIVTSEQVEYRYDCE